MIRTLEFWPLLASGLLITLSVSAASLSCSLLLGFAIGFARCYGSFVWPLCLLFTEVFRSVPTLLLVFGMYYGATYAIGLDLSPFLAAVVALSLTGSAHIAEVVRSSFDAVSHAQWDAASALGMRFWTAMRTVIAPQALRVAIPPLINVLVGLIKDSSFASVIGVVELTRSASLVRETTGDSILALLAASVAYFTVCFALSRLSLRLEARLTLP